MKSHKKSQPLQLSGIILGGISAMLVTVIASALITYLVVGQTIGEGRIAAAATGITFVSCFAGCLISGIVSSGGMMIATLITAGIYGLILLIMGMFMDGTFNGVLICIGILVCGSMASYVICRKGQRKRINLKRHSR